MKSTIYVLSVNTIIFTFLTNKNFELNLFTTKTAIYASYDFAKVKLTFSTDIPNPWLQTWRIHEGK